MPVVLAVLQEHGHQGGVVLDAAVDSIANVAAADLGVLSADRHELGILQP